jgi:hypothetical protein
MSLPRLPFSKALRTLVETGTGKPCGLGVFPLINAPGEPEHNKPVPPPFSVLYVVPGSNYSGPPMADDHADVEWTYQLTYVAQREDQAQWLFDRGHGTVLDRTPGDGQVFVHPLIVDGMTVMRRRHVTDGVTPSEGDVVSLFEQFAFTVTRS